jgi:hypothetical protein
LRCLDIHLAKSDIHLFIRPNGWMRRDTKKLGV